MPLEKEEAEESLEKSTEKTVISRVIKKEKVSRPVNLELEDFMPKNMDKPKQYNNWYFVVNFKYRGKDYLGKFAITQGNLVHQNTKINLSPGPLSLVQEDNIDVIEKPTKDIAIIKQQEDKAFKYRKEKDAVIIEMDELTAICKEDERKIISTNKTLGCELTLTPRGPPTYWGGKKNERCQIMESGVNLGIETLSDVRGKIILNGKEIKINSRGLFERVVVESVNFLEIRSIHWNVMNFDQMYTFLYCGESATSKGCPFHYETGTIYLIPEDDYLITKKIEVMPEKWAYIKEIHRSVPYKLKVKAETDKGNLELSQTFSTYPVFIEDPRRIEWLTLFNITGWDVLFFDAPVTIEGKFTYKDGKTVNLTNGTGVNEQIKIVPI